MKTIEIHTGRPYAISVESGLLWNIVPEIRSVYRGRRPKFAIVTDNIVDGLYGEAVSRQLSDAGYEVCKFAFPNGEPSKNLDVVRQVYSFLSENNITRTDAVIALGGGVVGDLAGFAAATWLRGIEFIQIPTTFLAMIDSSVGGKTGVDIPQGKNLVGAFWQPSLVICDVLTLKTLPQEIFTDGIAEAIKYGAIFDEKLFAVLEEGMLTEQLETVICRCIDLKRECVEQDERDKGVRQLLNFGHTLGHAVERFHNYTLSHGRGVAIGMCMITQASERLHISPPGATKRIAACCEKYGLPISTEAPYDLLCQYCMGDKKRAGSKINLIVLDQIGKASIYPIETDRLETFIRGESHA